MIGALFVLAARDFAALAAAPNKRDTAREYRAAADRMAAAIENHGWDGAWFLRAYDHAGRAVGSHENDAGQIFVEPQALCGMAGIGAESGLVDKALASVAERLACEFGVQLLDPPYPEYRRELGEISTYLPGLKENGSVFCHTNPWLIIAEAKRGRSDRALQYLRAIAPTYQSDPDTRRTEPYVYAQMVAGVAAAKPGEAKNSWLTGSASWSYVAVTQYILGIRASVEGLAIDPCIPPEWPGFSARRRFRGATYDLTVVNSRAVGRGVREVVVNGEPIAGNVIPTAEPGATVRVRVELG